MIFRFDFLQKYHVYLLFSPPVAINKNKSAVSSDGLETWTGHIYLLLLLFLILAVLYNAGMEHSNEDVLQRILQYRILRGSGIWINIHKTDQTKKPLMMPGFSLYFT